MQEIELKFQVPAERCAALERWLAQGGVQLQRQRLQAAYFDTPQRDLAQAGLALRLRREGRQWVQTLKGAGADGMSRLEHNVTLPARAAALPALDPARHAGHPAGERLLALLERPGLAPLQCLYRTDIQRLSRPLRTRSGQVELAYDCGELLAEGADGRLQRWPVCELEIELLSGAPAAVLDVARRHALRQGLWLDSRSKAERGDLLARGLAMAAPCRARRPALQRGMGAATGLREVLQACLAQILPNQSQIADGVFVPEHLHQLRVGLRRLRSALALFRGLEGLPAAAQPAMAVLGDAARQAFQALGAARDADVQAALFGPELAQARAALGLPAPAAGAGPAAADEPAVRAALAAAQRAVPSQGLLLDLLGLILLLAEPAEPLQGKPARLRPQLRRRLRRWQRQLAAQAAAAEVLDERGRHALRKRIKRLRYGLEFGAALLDAERLKPLLRTLAQAQQALGELNDLALAIARRRAALAADDAETAFELGWLLARQQQALAALPRQLAALAA